MGAAREILQTALVRCQVLLLILHLDGWSADAHVDVPHEELRVDGALDFIVRRDDFFHLVIQEVVVVIDVLATRLDPDVLDQQPLSSRRLMGLEAAAISASVISPAGAALPCQRQDRSARWPLRFTRRSRSGRLEEADARGLLAARGMGL